MDGSEGGPATSAPGRGVRRRHLRAVERERHGVARRSSARTSRNPDTPIAVSKRTAPYTASVFSREFWIRR